MFEFIFEFMTEPLGLPVEIYWEYLILAALGFIAYIYAYEIVGRIYRSGHISGYISGSFLHWVIRTLFFVVTWAISYGVIWLGKLVFAHWQAILIGLGIATGGSGLLALALFAHAKIKKSKAVKSDA